MITALYPTVIGWALSAALAAAPEPRPAETTPPAPVQTVVGPFRLIVDRVSHNRTSILSYREPDRQKGGGMLVRRSAQLQLAVYGGPTMAPNTRISFLVNSITAGTGSRNRELSFYGGRLENPNDPALIRSYVYASGIPNDAVQISRVEGEIVAFERCEELFLEMPVGPGANREPVTRDGLTLKLVNWRQDGGIIRVQLSVQGQPGVTLVNPASDGAHGVALVGSDNRTAPALGGEFTQDRDERVGYHVGFQNLSGMPSKLRVRLMVQRGERKVYPFRIEGIPIPSRHD